MMSDTYDEDDMPNVECIFDEIEYFMGLNPMLVYEVLLEDSKFNAMADLYFKTYGDIVECQLPYPLTNVKGYIFI